MTTDPQTPVEELEGRELDAAVAEEVFGWKVEWRDKPPFTVMRYVKPDGDAVHPDNCPHYSTDIAAAWEVVDRFIVEYVTEDDLTFDEAWTDSQGAEEYRERHGDKRWVARLRDGYDGPAGFADGETAPLAICRAALKAVRDE